jgi:hypothetical protein
MKELKHKYLELKAKAVELMAARKVNAYLATLVEVQDLRTRLMQLSASRIG